MPPSDSLTTLREAARNCRACDLYRHATQTVFGEGQSRARILVVGEEPGDVEDREGQVFVGPAGKLLDRALEEAGIQRPQIYLTNAVKHFKFEERGKRRIHKKPNSDEIEACWPWLVAEMAIVRPRIVVALGVTASQSLLSSKATIKTHRGKFLDTQWAKALYVTVHPASILRALPEEHKTQFEAFVKDWKAIKAWLGRQGP